MKVGNVIKKCIVFGIVPCLQRTLSLAARMTAFLSQVLDVWAYSTARGLTEDRALSGGRKINFKALQTAGVVESKSVEEEPSSGKQGTLHQPK